MSVVEKGMSLGIMLFMVFAAFLIVPNVIGAPSMYENTVCAANTFIISDEFKKDTNYFVSGDERGGVLSPKEVEALRAKGQGLEVTANDSNSFVSVNYVELVIEFGAFLGELANTFGRIIVFLVLIPTVSICILQAMNAPFWMFLVFGYPVTILVFFSVVGFLLGVKGGSI